MIKYINKYAIQQLGVTKTGTGISLPIHEKKLKYVLPNDRAHRCKMEVLGKSYICTSIVAIIYGSNWFGWKFWDWQVLLYATGRILNMCIQQ